MKEAATPPMGPVFVSLPMDVLDAPNDEEIVPTSFLETRVDRPARPRSTGPPSTSPAPTGR